MSNNHDERAMLRNNDERITLGDNDSLNTTSTGPLAHLDDLKDFKIADGEPDIRGWDVRTTDGQKVGKVEDLLVDTAAMKVRYIEVKLEKDVARDVATDIHDRAMESGELTASRELAAADIGSDEDYSRFVLVPIGVAHLDDEDDDVLLDARAAEMAGIPAYSRELMTRDYEREVLRGYGGGIDDDARPLGAPHASPLGAPPLQAMSRDTDPDPFYSDRTFDDRSFLGNRREPRDEWSYVRRADDVRNAERGVIDDRRVEDGRDVSRRDRDLLESPSDLDSSVRDQINRR